MRLKWRLKWRYNAVLPLIFTDEHGQYGGGEALREGADAEYCLVRHGLPGIDIPNAVPGRIGHLAFADDGNTESGDISALHDVVDKLLQ